MSALPESTYAAWRGSQRAAFLRETTGGAPPERLLQAVWLHQRVLRDSLVTTTGEPMRVLHPGFRNREAGPDFHAAIVQVGDGAPRAGDVEIDLEPAGWRGHAHESNPAYSNVILHVVWSGAASSNIPTLALKSVLDAPLDELARWLDGEVAISVPATLAGQCAAPLRGLDDATRASLLRQAAEVRLQSKAAALHARARQCGWELALLEGLTGALGYKHNVWPMHRLAGLAPRLLTGTGSRRPTLLEVQARTFGVAGLLPDELPRKAGATGTHLRALWDVWWREREAFADVQLPRSAWRFAGFRPANHPQRRLALLAYWLVDRGLFRRIDNWFTRNRDDSALVDSLLAVFDPGEAGFWSWHWTFRSARMAAAQPLLGATRVTDLAVNVLLPWFWARAAAGHNAVLCGEALRRFHAWPAAGDNAALRLARERLLGGASARAFRTAASQQGLLQIVRDFCDQSDALCTSCRFPDLVRSIGASAPPDSAEAPQSLPTR
jgi:hypothetical protein